MIFSENDLLEDLPRAANVSLQPLSGRPMVHRAATVTSDTAIFFTKTLHD